MSVRRISAELDIVGYADRLSVAPGGTVTFFVSAQSESFEADIVRVHRDPALFETIETVVSARYKGRRQTLTTGSYAFLAGSSLHQFPSDLRISLSIWSSLSDFGSTRGLITWSKEAGVFLSPTGHIVGRFGGIEVRADQPLVPFRWHHLRFWMSPASREIGVAMAADGDSERRAIRRGAFASSMLASDLRISGWLDEGRTLGCFDGKISDPRIESESEGVVAAWTFAGDHASDVVADRGGRNLDLRLSQHPKRAVTGPGWSGSELDFRLVPAQYNAIAFHSDDLTDAGWTPTIGWQVPDGMPSDVYALRVRSDAAEDHIPFVVAPVRPPYRAKVALLLPTFSYLCYANEHHWWEVADVVERTGGTLEDVLSPGEKWAFAHRLLSCYDRHLDGSGCIHSSYLRPILNFRAGYVHPYVRGPHQFSADLILLDWLRSIGEDFEVLTDHDLHCRGPAALQGYRVVLTGSHPEYVSEQMMNALEAFVAGGGNLMYLGGNGFHNVVSTYPSAPHVVELRRGHAGGAHWKSAPGEAHHASSGTLGGKWRLRGNAAHKLTGVATASVSFGRAQAYRRTAESYQPANSWIFEGVEGDLIDGPGRVMGGPAGFEYDRMDPTLGTPQRAVCLATARFQPAVTEYTMEDERWTGRPGENRADLVFIPPGEAGAVFSVGSIAWTGCLLEEAATNKVASITLNVLRRFKSS